MKMKTTDKIRLSIFGVLFALLLAVLLLVSKTQTSLSQIHHTLKEMQKDSQDKQPQIIVPLYTDQMPPPWISSQPTEDK